MADEGTHFTNLFQGKRIKLTLKTSFCFGVVRRITSSKTVALAKVAYGDHGCELPGIRLFYGHEILNVEFANEEDKTHGNIPEDHLKLPEFHPFKTFHQADHDDEYIKFEVIDAFNEKFGPAVMEIKKQHVVSVGADGVDMYKHGKLCWLQIATKHKVFLFDILLLGAKAFKNGLCMILENRHILKVIHDCRAVAGCLMTQFGVKLTHVFDTQVADVLCFYSETGGFFPHRVSTLHEVEETKAWYKRPCPLPLLNVMALSVIHLQPLRMVLLDSILMDYMTLVDTYLSNSQYPLENLECINLDCVFDFPSELRLLEQMRSERRERAAKLYPVTEKGLLVRSSPQTEPAPQTSPATEEDKCTQPAEQPSSPPPVQADQNTLSATLNVVPSDPLPNTLSEPVSEIPFSGVGRGFTSLLMGVMGRGRPFGKEKTVTNHLPTPSPYFDRRPLDSDTTSTDAKMEEWD
ncbi:piRNA biogenesis protein EXD1 isoform X2 [Hippocampus zosterae]|uniref:piRNA biogenesis protein EXD1 isoform X2 n=1 Tax=Hippocampus zosterae TaxID=109293 RepID=UPI00223D1EBA|nr:piRNA biogenesis protein EXD1 isoform X2 [Hippocampus zosterae]